MADVTITGLPNATVPLSGSERVPMDQAGTTVDASTQAIADLAAGTDLTYTQSSRTLASSTGGDVVLPLATDSLDGLMSAAHRALTAALAAAGVTVEGSAVVIPHIHGDLAGSVYIHVKNTSGGQLVKGTPVRVTGAVGDTTTLEVAAAQSSSAGTMPAIGILGETLAQNASGHAVVAGELTGLSTTGYSVGQALFVAAAGGLTATEPTSGIIQQIAIVGRGHGSTGSVTVTVGTARGQAAGTNLSYDASTRLLSSSTGDDVTLPLVTSSTAGLQPASSYGTITYAAQVTIDFAARNRQINTISLMGSLELLSSNLAIGQEVRLRLVCDGTQRTLTFPTDWRFVGAKPANIAALKVAVLSLASFGTTNADVVAAYAVQS